MKIKIALLGLLIYSSFNSYSQTTDKAGQDSIANAAKKTPQTVIDKSRLDSMHIERPPVPQAKNLVLPKGAVQIAPDEMQWVDGPATLPKGSKMCVLYGDMTKAEPFAVRFKLPANQVIKLHVHPNDEVVTVLEGAVMLGFGDRMQMSQTRTFTVGSFYVNPAKTKHFVAIDKDGATIQINAVGPWGIEFK